MRLFLASQADDPKTLKKLDEYVSGIRNKNIKYIPTAKNGNGEGRWQDSGTWKYLSKNVANLECIQLEDHLRGIEYDLFKEADIVWFSGGSTGYLAYWIIRTGFDLILPKILEKSLYLGSSSGAMVTGPTNNISTWYIGETERGANNIPSLHLVDFDLYPHYQEEKYDQIKKLYKGYKLYLVKDGEEIIVEDDKVTVIGEERIITN